MPLVIVVLKRFHCDFSNSSLLNFVISSNICASSVNSNSISFCSPVGFVLLRTLVDLGLQPVFSWIKLRKNAFLLSVRIGESVEYNQIGFDFRYSIGTPVLSLIMPK